jgi:hypothetical protein
MFAELKRSFKEDCGLDLELGKCQIFRKGMPIRHFSIVSRSRLAGKAIYFVTRATILEDSNHTSKQMNCPRFCANPDIAIITAHTKFALAEEEMSGRERNRVERRCRSPHKGGREGV